MPITLACLNAVGIEAIPIGLDHILTTAEDSFAFRRHCRY
jgi:hypothetical protein